MKYCTRCERELSEEAFSTYLDILKDGTAKIRLKSWCKECCSNYAKSYKRKKPEERIKDFSGCNYCAFNIKDKGCNQKRCIMLEEQTNDIHN